MISLTSNLKYFLPKTVNEPKSICQLESAVTTHLRKGFQAVVPNKIWLQYILDSKLY